MVLNEIESVLHEADRRLYLGRDLVSGIPVPAGSPSKWMSTTRRDGSVWSDVLPNSDYWADLVALAGVLPTASV